MKKLLSLISLALTVTVAADNFNESFNAQLTEGNLKAADSILTVWNSKLPADPELFPARFNLLLSQAHDKRVMLSADSAQGEWQIALADTAGNEAGYMFGETTWNDSLVTQAFAIIDRGITAQPDRIDFRLGKAAAGTMTRRWAMTLEALDDMFDRNTENGGHWLGSGNVAVTDADTLLADAIFERMSEIFDARQPEILDYSLLLMSKSARYFSNDSRINNLAGAINFSLGDYAAALKYFERALQIKPDDAIPLTNIAYLSYQQGDTVKALELYRRIENGNYEEEFKQTAARMIADITAPVEDMEKYYYFFGYLPEIASMIQNPSDCLDVELINTRIPAFNKLRSPFADDDITVDEVAVDGMGHPVAVWTFPMPEKMPLCRFIAFVSDGKEACRIYTLEKSLPLENGTENYWVVGTTHEGSHSNFGDIPLPPDAKEFVKALQKKGLIK